MSILFYHPKIFDSSMNTPGMVSNSSGSVPQVLKKRAALHGPGWCSVLLGNFVFDILPHLHIFLYTTQEAVLALREYSLLNPYILSSQQEYCP